MTGMHPGPSHPVQPGLQGLRGRLTSPVTEKPTWLPSRDGPPHCPVNIQGLFTGCSQNHRRINFTIYTIKQGQRDPYQHK